MKKMQCEVCGSTEIRKTSDEVFECQSCGIQYSKSEVQKLLVEITGEVKIDRNEEVANMIKNVQRLYKNRDYDKVISSCDNILNMQPDNVEAILYSGYASANKTTVANIRLGDAYRAANDAIKIQYEKMNNSKEFFEFSARVLSELNTITSTIYEFCHETIVSANLMYSSNAFSGALDAKEELKDLQELVSTVVLTFFTKFDLLQIKDFSNANEQFFLNALAVMEHQYYGTYKNKLPQVKLDLLRLTLFKIPETSSASNKAAVLCAKFAKDRFVKSDAECQKLLESVCRNSYPKTSEKPVEKEDAIKTIENIWRYEKGMTEESVEKIRHFLKNGQKIEAIDIYRSSVGVGLADAKNQIERYTACMPNDKFQKNVSKNEPTGAEKWIHMFGRFGLTPYTFFMGIFTLCFVNKAKEENGGRLSEIALKGLKRGVIGFSIYAAIILFFIIMISMS